MPPEKTEPARIRLFVSPSDYITPEHFRKKLDGILESLDLPPFTIDTQTRQTIPHRRRPSAAEILNGDKTGKTAAPPGDEPQATVTDITVLIHGKTTGQNQKAKLDIMRALDKAALMDHINDDTPFRPLSGGPSL
jgi:hypothetical protein